MAPTPPNDPATSGTSAESAPPPGNLREAVGLTDQGPEALVWDSTRQAIEAAGYMLLRKPRAKQGASAVVLPAVETGSKRNVALKVITDPSKQASRNLLDRELQLFGIDDLPGVVVRYFAKLVDGRHQPVLVLEWIDGQSLRELLETQDLPPERRMRLTQSLFRHLSELHRAGYYWRDLSHNNILVSRGDRLRFIDFGSAKSIHDGRLSLNTVYAGGTEDFVAPAVKRGEREADVANDLFAAASAACRTLGCRRVTTTVADNRLLLRPRKELLAEVSARRIPKDFAEIVIETLIAADGGPDKSPEALAVAERLDEWFQGRQRSSQRRQQLAGLLVVALLLLGALGFGWRLYKEEVRSGRTAASAVLAQELAGRPNLNHKALAPLIGQVNELSASLNEAVDQAATARADALLAQLLAAQRKALEASHSLEAAEPLRASLGEVLTQTPWERTCPTIREREAELLRRWQTLGSELEGANFEAAWKGLQLLQRDTALLLAGNTQAGRAVRSRAEYRRLERGLSDRLRALPQFGPIASRVLDADRLLVQGQFDDSRGPGAATEFAQARAELDKLLIQNEDPDEKRLRLSFDETAVASLESRVATLEFERTSLIAERDQAQQLLARLEEEHAPLQRAKDRLGADLSASRRVAAQLEEKLAEVQARIEELARSEADLNATLAQARAELLAGTERVQALEAELANLRTTGVLEAGLAALAKVASLGPATFVNSIGARMIRIEPGTFQMGSPESEEGRVEDEPLHTVHLTRPFLMGETEVTQGQWKAVMQTQPWEGQDNVKEGDSLAASYINYMDALEFCRRLNDQERSAGQLPEGWEYGLPTEAQWEYACRAGTSTAYCSGDSEADLRRVAIFSMSRSGEFSHRVKSKELNAWGLSDMHGNVWEWTRDAWLEGDGFRDGQADPMVYEAGSGQRVLRGGSWYDDPLHCRSAFRLGWEPRSRDRDIGFRLCLLPNATLAQTRAELQASTERVQALEAELANLRTTGVLEAGLAALAKEASLGPATFVNSIGARMIRIEPGTFRMGSPDSEEGRIDDEPLHTVHLTRPFLIGETEVTQKQWRAVMQTQPWQGQNYVKEGDSFAASYINYMDALEFCRRLNDQERSAGQLPEGWEYGLPTEAQWEYACRAGSSTAFCSGNSDADLRRVAIFSMSRSGEYAHRVKSKKPNAWGLFDMHGNVWEWTLDAHSNGGGFRDGQTDPFVDGAGSAKRVLRGGSWYDDPRWCRSAYRLGWKPGTSTVHEGFRLCLLAGPGAPPEGE